MLAKEPSYIVVAGRIVMPGASIGTMNMLIPACGGLACVSVRAARNMYFPHHVVVQIFCPLMTHPSPSRVALVRRAARSEPAWGSLLTHAMHGLSSEYFRQVFPLLVRRAEHYQRVGLDRGSDPRRLSPPHGFDEGKLLLR